MLDEAGRREALPRETTALMRDGEIPNRLEAVGYTARDVPAPARGDAQAVAPLSCALRAVGAAERELILRDSMRHWS
jgi:hypothetical protein